MKTARTLVFRISALFAVAAFGAVCTSTAQAVTPFTVVAVPDIQNETQYAPDMLQAQVSWIVNHRDDQRIAYVSQQGDLTNHASDSEYSIAHDKLFQLNNAAGLPWGTCAGNHDSFSGGSVRYLSYFGPSNFAGVSWYGGSTSSLSSYQTFQAGGRDYLVLNIEYRAPASVLNWAQGVITANPGKPTIINTHDYMAYGNQRSDYGNKLWNDLIYNNPQVFMVLCGHNYYAYNQTSTNVAGKPVLELLADYQDQNHGGGYLRLLEFDEAHSAIHVKTYSPYNTTVPYLTDSANQFDIPMDFNARLGAVPECSALISTLTAIGAAVPLAYARRKRHIITQIHQGPHCGAMNARSLESQENL